MYQQVPFIGRQNELQKIGSLVQTSTTQVLCIEGEGGIGKTRLLQKIKERFNDLLIPSIIDFDNYEAQLPDSLQYQIANNLPSHFFEEYFSALAELRQIELLSNVTSKGIEQHKLHVQQTFLEKFNQFTSDKRVILRFDTVEKLEDVEAKKFMIGLMTTAQNTLFILAGRNTRKWFDELKSKQELNIQHIHLTPLEEKNAEEYLKQKQALLHISIEPEISQKVLLLSRGRPILIDLAVEWLSREQPINWLVDKSLSDLQSLPANHSFFIEFEVHLVKGINQIRTQLDKLVLIMSRIYPLTLPMISELMHLSDENTISLFEEAQTYTFIKLLPDKSLSLHDEMRRMVIKHVWPDIDPSKSRRQRDSSRASDFYQHEFEKIQTKLNDSVSEQPPSLEKEALVRRQEAVSCQWTEHAFYVGAKDAFSTWLDIADMYRKNGEARFARQLVTIILVERTIDEDDNSEKYTYYDNLTKEQKLEFDIFVKRIVYALDGRKELKQAREDLNNLLAKEKDVSRHAGIYNVLGLISERIGDLEDALENQKKCLAILERNNAQGIAEVANLVGYLHRLLGQREEAIKNYEKSLAIAKVNASENRSLIAATLNNIAYVQMLNKNYSQMEFLCHEAISIWKKIDRTREIGRAESTQAIAYRDRGNYLQAIEFLKRAIERYKEPDDHEKMTRAFFHLGWSQWYHAERINDEAWSTRQLKWDEVLLKEALQSCLESRRLADYYGFERILPGILHQTASIYWYLGRTQEDITLCDQARHLNDLAFQASEDVGATAIRYAIDSLVGYAEWDYEQGVNSNMTEYYAILKRYDLKPYPLYEGRMYRIEGDFAFEQDNFEFAFERYANGIRLIAEHGGFSRYSIDRELQRLSNRMRLFLSVDDVKRWGTYLLNHWRKLENKKGQDMLETWCEQQILHSELFA